MLKRRGYQFDIVYSSWLSRAIESAWYILDSMDTLWLPIIKTWRLNERVYGKLTGLSKSMVAQKYGQTKFQNWRRGCAMRPPKASSFSPNYPVNDMRYQKYVRDLPMSTHESFIRSMDATTFSLHRKFPKTESLKDCMDRTLPYYLDNILPEVTEKGKRVLISSSQNAIRGLLMHMCSISQEDIMKVEIPAGVPILYDLNTKRVTFLQDDDDHLDDERFDKIHIEHDELSTLSSLNGISTKVNMMNATSVPL